MLKERKVTIQRKEALGSQVGPNLESLSSFKNSELPQICLLIH